MCSRTVFQSSIQEEPGVFILYTAFNTFETVGKLDTMSPIPIFCHSPIKLQIF